MGLLRNSFFKVLFNFRIGHFLLRRNRKHQQIPVLVFHKIIPEFDAIWPGIHPRLFEEIIVMLKKHYVVLPLADLYTKKASELSNACFVTFDDGYKDFLDYAYPILKKHAVPSALFVLPYQITNKGHIWTSTIIFFIKHYGFDEIREFFTPRNVDISAMAACDDFALNLNITVLLCNMTQTRRMKIVNELREKFIVDNRIIENELLSFAELRLLDPAYVTIASHSLTHPSFKEETNQEFLEAELRESKEIIERETRRAVTAFAFPFSNYNAASSKIARCLYTICFTKINAFVQLRRLQTEKDYRYDLPRFNIHHGSAEEVFLLINGFHKQLGR